MTTAALSQSNFRARNDGGAVDATAGWIANENANFTWGVESNFRIRFTVQETAGGNPAAAGVKLQANLNGGGFQDVTTSSTIVKAVNYSSDAENTAVTVKRLSGTGTFVNGRYSNDGSPTSTVDLTANANTEWEFAVRINAADVVDGDTVICQLVALSGTAITVTGAGTNRPSITVAEAATDNKGWFPQETFVTRRSQAQVRAAAAVAAAVSLVVVPSTPVVVPTIGAPSEPLQITSRLIYDPVAMPVFQSSGPPPTIDSTLTCFVGETTYTASRLI